MDTSAEHLQELSDPEFFTHWTALRTRLALTPKGKPGHAETKARYDAASAEYRRRMAPRETAS